MIQVVEMSLMEQWLPRLPSLLVCLLGVILAIVYWRRCPAAGRLMMSGICIILLSKFIGVFLLPFVVGLGHERAGLQGAMIVQNSAGFVCNGVYAIGIALLLAAAFSGRGKSSAEEEKVGMDIL